MKFIVIGFLDSAKKRPKKKTTKDKPKQCLSL